jgi:hypothetical protein
MKSTSQQSSVFQSFRNGALTPQEFAVMVTVQALANGSRSLSASTTKISAALNGNLSRHAVARALRNLQRDNWLTWNTSGGSRNSVIAVN